MEVLTGIRVRNMESPSSFRNVPNQFIIDTPTQRIFQSYDKIIAIRKDGKVYLDKNYWDYSVTTGKYRNQFLGDDGIAETRRKIKEGRYILADLN